MTKDLSKKIMLLEPEPEARAVKKMEDFFLSCLSHRPTKFEWLDRPDKSDRPDPDSDQPDQ